MNTIPREGACRYRSAGGSVDFDSASFKSSMKSQAIYDSAGRTVKYLTHTLSVRVLVNDDNDVSDTVEAMRKALMTAGGKLTIASVGFGDFLVNIAAGDKDVSWGPRPQSFNVELCGGKHAAWVDWVVQFQLANCENDPVFHGLNIMELVSSTSFSKDSSGYSRRTVTVKATIAQTRRTPESRTVEHSVDEIREKITPPPLRHFRRVSEDTQISEDFCSLTLTVVDQELEGNVPYPGITNCSVSHEIHNAASPKGPNVLWSGRIHGTFEVAPDYPRWWGYRCFVELFRRRFPEVDGVIDLELMHHLRNIFDPAEIKRITNKFEGIRKDRKDAVQINDISIGEPNLYSRQSCSMSIGYVYMCALDNVVNVGRLWEATSNTGTEWEDWKTSLDKSAFHPRGVARLKHSGPFEAIVDLCEVPKQPTNSLKASLPSKRIADANNGGNRPNLPFPFQNKPPAPELSWLMYDSAIRLEVEDGTVELIPLPKRAKDVDLRTIKEPELAFMQVDPTAKSVSAKVPQQEEPSRVYAQIKDKLSPLVQPHQNTGGKTDSIVQMRAKPRVRVVYSGVALRAGYPVPIPALREVGGVECIPHNRIGVDFTESAIADNWYGTQIFRIAFQLTYILPRVPAGIIEVPRPPLK